MGLWRYCGPLVLAALLLPGCRGPAHSDDKAAFSRRQVTRICMVFHRRKVAEHLDAALPDNGPALLRLTAKTESLLRDQLSALAATRIPPDAVLARRWLADQRRLLQLFDAERRALKSAIPRERQRAAQWARLDQMQYAEVRALGRRYRPLELLALAMRARHKQVVAELPVKMRRLRERQARFYMLNAPDSPVAIAGRYTGTRIHPLVMDIQRLAPHVGGTLCPPSDA